MRAKARRENGRDELLLIRDLSRRDVRTQPDYEERSQEPESRSQEALMERAFTWSGPPWNMPLDILSSARKAKHSVKHRCVLRRRVLLTPLLRYRNYCA